MAILTNKIPDRNPIEFMPNLVQDDKIVHKGVFNPELSEYYYTLSDRQFKQFDVYVVKRNGDEWSKPEKAFFNSDYDDHGMSFSPDGKSIYFSSTRPTGIEGVSETWHIWKSEKVDEKWQQPEYVDIPNLRDKLVSHPTITNNGTLYFHSSNLDYSEMDIYRSYQSDGKIAPATKISVITDEPVMQKCTPFISPNEDYILFASVETQLDLIIAYNDGNGKWINSRKLSNTINNKGQGNPSVTPDNKYLFYTTGNSDGTEWKVKWVNIENEIKVN